MGTGFTTPPQHDFQSCSRLAGDQASHLTTLEQWSGTQCSNTGGLEGLLAPLTGTVRQVSRLFEEKIGQCQRGMSDVSGKIALTGQDYARADQASLDAIRGIYPSAISHFPDIGALHLPNVGNFTDEPVNLTPPQSAEEDTAEDLHHQALALRNGFGSGSLAVANKVYQFCTGQSLIAQLMEPLLGQYGRLRYLHDAYTELSSGLYTVAATTRKGSWALADEWTGDAATNFDSYMFRWSMGIGGLGDAAALIAEAYLDGYHTAVALAATALQLINSLVNKELNQLAAEGAKITLDDLAIEAAGLGPEDPIGDVVAGLWTAYQLYRIYKIVANVITAINAIEAIYREISKAISGISTAIHTVIDFFDSPLPSIGSLINDVEQRGFSFEQDKGWSPSLGAARIALLPAA